MENGKILNIDFKAVPVNEIPANSICISCIWWDGYSDCYFTQIDVMYLLEQLMEAPGRFSIKKKNHLRRSLEGFHPITISKTNLRHSEFFKTVMALDHPRPRKMERDFKVFPWSLLEQLVKKVIEKFSIMLPESNNRIPRRKRRLNAKDTPVASSKVPMICPDRLGTYLPWLEHTLFNIVKDLDADEDVRERLFGVFPDLLGAFALKTGYDMPPHAHHDAEYFVEEYRQEVNSLQE